MAETKPTKNGAQKPAKTRTATGNASKGFTDEERLAMKERDVRFQRRREPRRRRHVADLFRAEGVDSHRRSKDRHAREESGESATTDA